MSILGIIASSSSKAAPIPVPVCNVILNGDAAAGVPGVLVPDIDGQSFSITDAAQGLYIAGTPLAELRAMPASGKRVWIEGKNFLTSNPGSGLNVRIGFSVVSNLGQSLGLVQIIGGGAEGENGVGSIRVESITGAYTSVNAVLPQVQSSYSLALDSEGEIYFYDRVAGEVVAASTLNPGFSGIVAGATFLVGIGMIDGSGTAGPLTASGDFVTSQNLMTDRLALGKDEDWCGNLIVGATPSMVAGYFSLVVGENLAEAWGYLVSQGIGSISGIPLEGSVMRGLYVEAFNGSITRRLAEFSGDVTAILAGKSFYLNDTEYALGAVTYYAGTDYTEVLLPTIPTFIDGVTYTVDFI